MKEAGLENRMRLSTTLHFSSCKTSFSERCLNCQLALLISARRMVKDSPPYQQLDQDTHTLVTKAEQGDSGNNMWLHNSTSFPTVKFFSKLSVNKKPTQTLRKATHPALSGNKLSLRTSGSKSNCIDAIKKKKICSNSAFTSLTKKIIAKLLINNRHHN